MIIGLLMIIIGFFILIFPLATIVVILGDKWANLIFGED